MKEGSVLLWSLCFRQPWKGFVPINPVMGEEIQRPVRWLKISRVQAQVDLTAPARRPGSLSEGAFAIQNC